MKNNSIDFIIKYESGECESEEEIISGFQQLLDSGILFQLQGSYGRAGIALLQKGLIVATEPVYDFYGNYVAG